MAEQSSATEQPNQSDDEGQKRLVQLLTELEKERAVLEQQAQQTSKEYNKSLERHRLMLRKKMDKESDIGRMDSLLETAQKRREELIKSETQTATAEKLVMAGLAKLSEQIVDCQRRKVEQLCVAGKRANSAVGGLVKKCQQLQLRNCRDGGLDLSRQIEEMKRRGDELNKSLADAHKDVAKLTVAKKNVVQYADILLDNKKFILELDAMLDLRAAMKEERKKARAKLMQVHLRRRFLEKRPIHHR